MTDCSDLVDKVAAAIRPVIQCHIARAYGIDDLGALLQEAAQAATYALCVTDRSDLTQRITDVLLSYGSNIGATHYQSVADEVVSVLSTWDGIMALLDIHYPESVFPTAEDRNDRDTGPRIVSLLRQINELRAANKRVVPMRDPYHSAPSDPT